MNKKLVFRAAVVVTTPTLLWVIWLFIDNLPTTRIDYQKIGSSDIGSLAGVRGSADSECRQSPFEEKEPLGFCNLEALVGMPDEFVKAIRQYVDEVCTEIRAEPMTRPHYYHPTPLEVYPISFIPVHDTDIRIPVVIFPRPGSVSLWSESTKGQKMGWVSLDQATHQPRSPFGCTILFRPGTRSEHPYASPALPRGGGLPSSAFESVDLVRAVGKMVAAPEYRATMLTDEASASLRFGKIGGATIKAEILTVSPFASNPRLRWTSIRNKGLERRFLAYALVDGNGCLRGDRRIPPFEFVRPLICTDYRPMLHEHDALLLPTPLVWAPTFQEMLDHRTDLFPCEDWCLDDWFPTQKDACWVIREAEDSKPLRESFLLMPASEESERPVFFIALFAETEPKQLVKELAALYKVSPDTALNSPETMQRLNSLYERVRDFPLDK